MKCQHVQSVIVEYAEGALCVADELCVDIHLVQCDSCRDELRSIAGLGRSVARLIEDDSTPPDTLALLSRIDALPELPARREPYPLRRTGGTLLRAALAALIVFLAFTSGALTWHRQVPDWFGLLPAEAAAERPLVETLRPLTSDAELNALRDLNELTGGADPQPAH
jgi:predicted anti-sigma-YlaC factor YlaD